MNSRAFTMFPRSIPCEECGKKALVRSYGRVEYDWNADGGNAAGINVGGNDTRPLTIRAVRLTIDCPHCGLRAQEYRPEITDQAAQPTQPKKLRPATHTFASLVARATQPALPEIHH